MKEILIFKKFQKRTLMLSSSPVLKSRTHLELTCREDKLSIVITAEELKGTSSIEAEAVVVTIVLRQTSQKTILLQT